MWRILIFHYLCIYVQDWWEADWKYFHVGLCHGVACPDMTQWWHVRVSPHVMMSLMSVIPGHLLPPARPSYISISSLEFTHLFAFGKKRWNIIFREKRKCFIFIFAVLDVTIDHFDCSCCNHPNIILSLNSRIVLAAISS